MPLVDAWREVLLHASFGGQRIDVIGTDDDWSAALVQQSGPRRDGAQIDPMGAEPRRTSCTLVFFEREPDTDDVLQFDNHIARFVTFVQTAMQARAPLEFVHPLFGSYQAYVENVKCRADANEPNVLMVSADFVEDGGPAVLAYPELAPVASGGAQVGALAAELNAQLGAAGVLGQAVTAIAGVGAKATGLVDTWSNDVNVATRDVNSDLSAFSDLVSDSLLEINAATDLERFPIVRTLHRLHATMRRAAEQFRRSQPQVVVMTIGQATSLRALATALYGAAAAEARLADLLRLNDIQDPTYLAPGTKVQVLSTNPTGGQGVSGLRGGQLR